MNKEACAAQMMELPNGKSIYEEHLADYEEILLHVLASELISQPLIELLCLNKQCDLINQYCDMVELMWRDGTEDVVNVVDVTILERLSDEEMIWKRFGEYISDEFRRYINEELLPQNDMMGGVKPLHEKG
ncbi:DUF7674 family protein [Anaerosporobacter sp.]|uniref:DUF7674 family protein n=1 Tax=Anaerosporobacter sp. TaxID=1872529 RepID=UPI00286F0243|nr:hypothetical protein [Anaerosporobacter sp.]